MHESGSYTVRLFLLEFVMQSNPKNIMQVSMKYSLKFRTVALNIQSKVE
jgi:predicted transcriptional regulator